MSTQGKLHRGILVETDLVKETPQEDQLKMIRMLASKSALTSRIDVCKTYPAGDQGASIREAII